MRGNVHYYGPHAARPGRGPDRPLPVDGSEPIACVRCEYQTHGCFCADSRRRYGFRLSTHCPGLYMVILFRSCLSCSLPWRQCFIKPRNFLSSSSSYFSSSMRVCFLPRTWYVIGSLAVTRAMGDGYLKRVELSAVAKHLPYITCQPTIEHRQIVSTDVAIVLASGKHAA
jgi:hypothetical protein